MTMSRKEIDALWSIATNQAIDANECQTRYKFYELVAAAERKRLAWTQGHWTEYEHNIAAAERERMIQDGWRQCAKDQGTTQFCGQLQQAVEAEREACTKIAWNYEPDENGPIETAIRARGQQ